MPMAAQTSRRWATPRCCRVSFQRRHPNSSLMFSGRHLRNNSGLLRSVAGPVRCHRATGCILSTCGSGPEESRARSTRSAMFRQPRMDIGSPSRAGGIELSQAARKLLHCHRAGRVAGARRDEIWSGRRGLTSMMRAVHPCMGLIRRGFRGAGGRSRSAAGLSRIHANRR